MRQTPEVPSSSLNTETTIQLSQSMDSVNTTPEEEVRTLFVSGLPMDAKPRELYLLFRAYKGYEGSLLKVTNKNGKNTSPVGFVTFSSRAAAEVAKQDLQGVRFDPDLPQTLRLEFAKSNTKVTKPKQQSPQPAATLPTFIHPLTGQELGAAFIPGAPEAWAPHPLAAYPELNPNAAAIHHTALIQHPALAQVPEWIHHFPQIHHPAVVAPPTAVSAALPHPPLAATPILTSPISTMSTPSTSSSPLMQQNAPCSTLFVANLGQFSSEQELKDLFSSFQGFNRLRMHNKGGSPVAFVEFQDLKQATEALNRLQGFVLLSSDRGGIRIEYAKNKMGEVVSGL
ncbi:RNA-binding protein with multiple splicing 2,RNA-binding protein with multiple splicing,Protein couch potato [Mytilus coruscus]|uniref:RNA-binding protein with multiple splicing 2,RNA-binding protein with multiple splicing,Protein couch potato n=2 Tax=Mytilus TaxID=6548 RepID=A0A6J8ER42_MYTCO|nr:RNA-binding protein with multiple splicing 2,RNA-binding protein with multiple splicing,Protein couch potato [Mytilus coruscus]